MLFSPASLAKSFHRCESGGIAVLSILLMVVLIAVAGAAIDFGRALDARQRMQVALDRSLLAAATENISNEAAVSAKVKTSFLAAKTWGSELANISIELTLADDSITALAKADFSNSLLGAVWNSTMPVAVASQVTAGSRDIEIALVLDNTGSMASSNKIGILRASASNFVDEMETLAATNNKISLKLGVVPFTTQVRVGPTYVGAEWIAFENEAQKAGWEGCLWDRINTGSDRRDSHVEIKGPDVEDLYPATSVSHTTSGSKVYASTVCDLAPILDLTDDYDHVRARINDMTAHPQGFTNVGLGLIWGWNLLDPANPFTQGKPYGDEDTEKFIILLTDGDNTFNRRALSPYDKPKGSQVGTLASGQLDKNTQDTCANVKENTNIRVFTIRVVAGNQALLKNCATSASMFYDVKNPKDMEGVFKDIAQRIKEIHLSI